MSICKKSIIIAITAIGLAGCQAMSFYQGQPRAASFEGEWQDQNGIISSFNAGKFETKTTDGTDTLLAVGTYQKINPSYAQIEVRSLVRRTVSQVNCALVNSSRMNCTSSTGSQFTLFRRS